MESESSDHAMFNSSTEFLISFDSAENAKPGSPISDQHSDGSSGVMQATVVGDEIVLANGQPVKTADSEHIVCEFADDGTDLFPSRNTGAGESVNSDDVWLSLMSCVKPDVHTDVHEFPALSTGENFSEACADRKADYIKHSVDISSPELAVGSEIMGEATKTTLLHLEDASCRMLTDGDHSEAADQFSASAPAAAHPFTNELDSVKQESNVFSDFTAFSSVVTENANDSQSQMDKAYDRKLDNDDISQHKELFNPFPDGDEFSQPINDSEHMWMPIFSTAQVSDQQIIGSSDNISSEKSEICTSLPGVHSSATKQEVICAFPDQLFSAEVSPNVTVMSSVDGGVAIEEIQVNSLDSFATHSVKAINSVVIC